MVGYLIRFGQGVWGILRGRFRVSGVRCQVPEFEPQSTGIHTDWTVDIVDGVDVVDVVDGTDGSDRSDGSDKLLRVFSTASDNNDNLPRNNY